MSRAADPKAFLYLAATSRGSRSMGLRRAKSPRALAEALRRDKLVVLRSWSVPAWLAPEQTMAATDQAALNEQLAQLVSRGVPLVEALEVAGTVVKPAQRSRVDRMRERVAAGSSFADAAATAGGFDRVTVSVYRAAERTGELADAAEQLARTIRRRLAVQGKAITLLIYPAIVSLVGILAGVLMLTVIVPRIGGSLEDAGIDLPIYTQFVIALGRFMTENALPLLGALAGLIVTLIILKAPLIVAFGRLARKLPLVGEVLLTQELARFFSVMAAMSKSGVALADALGISSGAVSHPVLRKELDQLRIRLVEGGVLRTLINRMNTLPMATRTLLVAADRAGDLDGAFDELSQDMADRLDTLTGRLLAALEPLLIILLFLFIGALLMSIMVPLLTLTSQQFG
ncbi:MAG: type II secretion system F family protein [Planctomycetota bacterium]